MLLLPTPRKVTVLFNDAVPYTALRVEADASPMAVRLLSAFIRQNEPSALRTVFKIDPSIGHEQGYSLRIDRDAVTIRARSQCGMFYGACTLAQILQQHPEALPQVAIDDSPDFSARGVMLDVSRDKVPTMATLRSLIDLLASWKINQIQLYIEHTFAYSQHRAVWEHASPFTADEIRQVDVYCRERFIELVPNQNSFGHMERWLQHPAYLPLAEAPEGSQTPWNFRWEGPFSLCPTDGKSLDFLAGLYAEYLPNFSSKQFNVGCDETFDIGQGRSKAACIAKGETRVYLEFLLQVQKLVKHHGRTMQFWGDIILKHPELVPELPKDCVALNWGYEWNHPFDTEAGHFAAAGVPFYVCPGTSSWCSIVGRTTNALGNLRSAADAGVKHGAVGYLNTDWGDYGHLQYLPISYLPFAAGAALSWCVASNRDSDFTAATSRYAFGDPTGQAGRAIADLGNLYLNIAKRLGNGWPLFRVLVKTLHTEPPLQQVTLDEVSAVGNALEDAASRFAAAPMQTPDADLVRAEVANSAAMIRYAVARAKELLSNPDHPPARRDEALRPIMAEHQRLWLARNRAGGLADSIPRLISGL